MQLADIRNKTSDLRERQITTTNNQTHRDPRAAERRGAPIVGARQGAVIGPGEQVMLIVPDADSLVAEVHVAPRDIDQVSPQQSAMLASRPSISAPRRDQGLSKARRRRRHAERPHRQRLLRGSRRHNAGGLAQLHGMRLFPGMPVDVFIRTSERTMLSYLLNPLNDQVQQACREK